MNDAMTETGAPQVPAELQGPCGLLPGCYRFTPPGFDGAGGQRVHWWLFVPRTKVDLATAEAEALLVEAARLSAQFQADAEAWRNAPADAKPARPVDPTGAVYRMVEPMIAKWCKGVTIGETFYADVAAAFALLPTKAIAGVVGAIGNAALADELYPKS